MPTISILKQVYRGARRILGRDPRLAMLDDCAAGTVPVPIALMHLASQTEGQAEIEGLIARALGSRKAAGRSRERLLELESLARRHPGAHDISRRITGAFTTRPAGVDEVEHWVAEFDRLVAVSPEASVALYSFGDPALLRQLTEELAGKLGEWKVLRRDSRVLDYGCGIGRVALQIAGRAATVVAVDISSGMLREARARLAGIDNVVLQDARSFLADKTVAPFDLILLIDVCPYLADATPLLAGLSGRLAEGASLLVMNWSYDLPLETQRSIARDFARQQGLELVRAGTAEFSLWDGRVFHFLKPGRRVR